MLTAGGAHLRPGGAHDEVGSQAETNAGKNKQGKGVRQKRANLLEIVTNHKNQFSMDTQLQTRSLGSTARWPLPPAATHTNPSQSLLHRVTKQ